MEQTQENSPEEIQDIEEFKVIKLDNLDAGALATHIKAEIDMQISTARAYPRSISLFLKKVQSLATQSQAVAESCTYALPRREKNKKTGAWETKMIHGPSVRFAEIVVASYGNIRAGARVVNNNGKYVTAQGVCHDLESNSSVTLEVSRKITGKDGRTFSEDMQIVTGNAAAKIAYRNAVFSVVPPAILIEVYERVKATAKGTLETLPPRREKALNYFRAKGVTDKQICQILEVKEINDIDIDKLYTLSAMKTALDNEETTIDVLFPPEEKNVGAKANDTTAQAMKGVLNKATGKDKKE